MAARTESANTIVATEFHLHENDHLHLRETLRSLATIHLGIWTSAGHEENLAMVHHPPAQITQMDSPSRLLLLSAVDLPEVADEVTFLRLEAAVAVAAI